METKLAMLGIWELLIILLIVVVIFGAARLPQLGENLGKAIRNFRKSFKGDKRESPGEARRLDEGPEAARLPPGQREDSAGARGQTAPRSERERK